MKLPIRLTILGTILASASLASAATIVTENFGGGTGNINGTTADTFDPAITSAGGSSTWVARTLDASNNPAVFLAANGTVNLVSGANAASAYLGMGSYINAAKGTSSGLFTLSATINSTGTANTWVSLGFFQTPTVSSTFITTGLASIIQRNFDWGDAGPAEQELDMWGGLGSGTGSVDGPQLASGPQLVTIVLDLTPTGGYNGTSNFGTVTWYDGTASGTDLGSYTYLVDRSFDAIGFSQGGTTGSVDDLTFSQIPEPSAALLGGLGLLCLLRRRR
jgi:hypothetical protein